MHYGMHCRNNAHRTCARRTNGVSDFCVDGVMGRRTYGPTTFFTQTKSRYFIVRAIA